MPMLENVNFSKWFGDSKVVDEEGEPLIVYHGTRSGGFVTFDSDSKYMNPMIFFTDSIEVAATYSESKQEAFSYYSKQVIYHVYLKIENPLIVNAQGFGWEEINWNGRIRSTVDIAEHAFAGGYDGLIIKDVSDIGEYGYDGIQSTVYIVFSPQQIKSATVNTGDYDPADPDIRKNPSEAGWSDSRIFPSEDAIETQIVESDYWITRDPAAGAQIDKAVTDFGMLVLEPEVVSYSLKDNPQAKTLIKYAEALYMDYLSGHVGPTEERQIDEIEKAWESEEDLENLPPITVRSTGTLLDGWHRVVVAIHHGQTDGIPALVARLVEPPRKSVLSYA